MSPRPVLAILLAALFASCAPAASAQTVAVRSGFVSSSAGAAGAPAPDDAKLPCVYAAHHIATLVAFGAMVHRSFDCALVYNDASPDWAGWEDPWFTHHPDPDLNWAKWVAAKPGRKLIITQNLFPASVNGTAWRAAGARGDFDGHARALAARLVAVGLGSSIIRLGHEANGTWYPDSIGTTDQDFAQWRAFWRHMVFAMRSVAGAHFRFDWTVNAAYRPIALSKWYPGDDAADIVGVDTYDSGVAATVLDRWGTIFNRPFGVRDLLAFARAHGKPLSIPEWGVGARGSSSLAGGDDSAYVNGIAGVVAGNRVAYQSYFYNHEWATQLAQGPRSLAAYRSSFGVATTRAAAGRRRTRRTRPRTRPRRTCRCAATRRGA
jgi:hypothetical protein